MNTSRMDSDDEIISVVGTKRTYDHSIRLIDDVLEESGLSLIP